MKNTGLALLVVKETHGIAYEELALK